MTCGRRQPLLGSSTTCCSADRFLIVLGQKAHGNPWRGTSGTSMKDPESRLDSPVNQHQTSSNIGNKIRWKKKQLHFLRLSRAIFVRFLQRCAGRFESNHIAKYFETRNGMLGADPWHRWRMVKISSFQCILASSLLNDGFPRKSPERWKRKHRRTWNTWRLGKSDASGADGMCT